MRRPPISLDRDGKLWLGKPAGVRRALEDWWTGYEWTHGKIVIDTTCCVCHERIFNEYGFYSVPLMLEAHERCTHTCEWGLALL